MSFKITLSEHAVQAFKGCTKLITLVSPRPNSAPQCASSLRFVTALLLVFPVLNCEILSSTRLTNLVTSAGRRSKSRFQNGLLVFMRDGIFTYMDPYHCDTNMGANILEMLQSRSAFRIPYAFPRTNGCQWLV